MLSEDELCCVLIAVSASMKKKKKRTGLNGRKWEKQWLLARKQYTHENLLNELRLCEPNDFRNFLRVDAELFDELLGMVTPQIQKRDTLHYLLHSRYPIGTA